MAGAALAAVIGMSSKLMSARGGVDIPAGVNPKSQLPEQEMVLRQATIEEELGRPFRMNDLEVDLSSFAGQIESLDAVRFYFTKKL